MNFWALSVDEFEPETLLGDENLSGAPTSWNLLPEIPQVLARVILNVFGRAKDNSGDTT